MRGEGMLIDNTLFGVRDKVQIAIDRIKQFEPPEGYYVAFSGGKDSLVVKDLVKKSGVKAEFHFNRSMEPPEVIYYIRKCHPDVIRHLPKHTMWQLIEKNMIPPTRKMRYCCREMKENDVTAKGRLVITGVRWEESTRRKGRQMVEQCRTDNSKRFLHPIIDWTEKDIWEYIHKNNLPYCSLYDEGFRRLGCIMCPMGRTERMQLEAEHWPKIAAAYKRACIKAYERRISRGVGSTKWHSGIEMYEWWIGLSEQTAEKQNPDQTVMFE
jgi:phosphoadenosine phosphosulfate reductase